MRYLVIFGFFHFHFCFVFGFRSKNVICVGPKMLCSQLNRGTSDFVFVFWPKMEFHFRRHFRFRPKMKYAFSVGLYIKLFQIRSYFNDFQTLNNPGSGQTVGALKN